MRRNEPDFLETHRVVNPLAAFKHRQRIAPTKWDRDRNLGLTHEDQGMKSTLGCLAQALYVVAGGLQVGAIVGGIVEWWGWPWWAAVFVATPIAYIPILGTIVGILGAVRSFGWSPTFAILLFCWPYVVYLVAFVGAGLSRVFSGSKSL